MTERRYGPTELVMAHQGELPEDFVHRRRMAAAMQQLSERLVRAEASTDDLAAWADHLEQLVQKVGKPVQRDARQANRRMFAGEASLGDIFDMMDFDPIGGLSNPVAPQMRWTRDEPEGIAGEVTLGVHYQGPPGRVHGGVLAWIMDAALSRAMHAAQKLGVTGTLTLRYLAPTPVDQSLHCTAHIRDIQGRKLFIEGALYNGDEQTLHAEGIFFQPKSLATASHRQKESDRE